MYRLTRTMDWVLARLHQFAHDPKTTVELESAERFILTFALMEKLIRRTLTELFQVRDGKLSRTEIAERHKKITWGNIEGEWKKYDSQRRLLSVVLGTNNEFATMQDWARMRNDLIHGNVQRYGQEYEEALPDMYAMLEHIKAIFAKEYGYYGWRGTKFS